MNVTMGTYQGKEEGLLRRVKEELSVRELLQCFSEPEQLTEDNTWYCPVCKDHKLADKVMSLYTLP
jgi:ubiquitin C-terminal hydrolase